MMEENVTLIGYNSRKQPYIYLFVSVFMFITGIICVFVAEGDDKYGCVLCLVVGIMFLIGFKYLLSLPKIAIKVIDDKKIYFYDKDEVKVIYISQVTKIHYWPAQIGLKITFFMQNEREHFTYLLSNYKDVKKHLLGIFKKYDIKVVNTYSK